MTDERRYDRRSMLKTSGVALAVGSFAGCIGGTGGGPGGSGGGTTTESNGEENVVEVGPGGSLTFESAELEVEAGTTVTWVWKSNNHNVVPKGQPDSADWQGTEGGDSKVYNDGYEYSYTFDVPGTYEYYCTPHKAAGMTGRVEVTGSTSATTEAAETEEETTEEETTETATADDLPILVGHTSKFQYEPGTDEPVVVDPGTEVRFVWKSDQHNIVVASQPEGANWEGTPGGRDKIYDEGYEYSYTFEVPGTYEFHCRPHKSIGEKGTIIVRETGATTETEETTTTDYATEDDLPVKVGPGGNLQFEPGTEAPLKVSVGTEVKFVWESDQHNVVVDSQPEGADWKGTPGPESKVYDTGYEYSHTFEVPGTYEFYCQAHQSVGAVGTIVVTED